MEFAGSGESCVNCSCRKTNTVPMKGLEIPASFVIPYVVHKCPHCHVRFWRLHIPKLITMLVLILAVGAGIYYLLHHDGHF